MTRQKFLKIINEALEICEYRHEHDGRDSGNCKTLVLALWKHDRTVHDFLSPYASNYNKYIHREYRNLMGPEVDPGDFWYKGDAKKRLARRLTSLMLFKEYCLSNKLYLHF